MRIRNIILTLEFDHFPGPVWLLPSPYLNPSASSDGRNNWVYCIGLGIGWLCRGISLNVNWIRPRPQPKPAANPA